MAKKKSEEVVTFHLDSQGRLDTTGKGTKVTATLREAEQFGYKPKSGTAAKATEAKTKE